MNPNIKPSPYSLVNALLRQAVKQTPVWMMRQAGRYLPEYRATREKAGSFLQLCQNPELACEVTLQPLRRYDLDAAILFSDILTVPNAMGLELVFRENEGPVFPSPIKSFHDVQALKQPDPEVELKYVMDAVRLIRQEMPANLPLIGFCGSPWTLATYMIEGGSCKNFALIKGLRYSNPKLLHQLLDQLSQALINYLNAQIHAGVQVVMIFDTWGGVLTTKDYREFSLSYMTKILQGLKRHYQQQAIPSILFTKGGSAWLELMADTGCSALGIDWTLDLAEAKASVGDKVALQGNLDPCVLYAPIEVIEQEVKQVLQSFGQGNGHVFNLGHGIHPSIDPEHVVAMINAVHKFSRQYH